MRTPAATPLLLASVVGLVSACGDDLGSCDEMDSMPPQAAAVLSANCGTCHSSDRTGADRQGAPAGLDFDTVDGRREWADEMWTEIEAGRMPPPAPAGSGELSSADKDTLRAWLACDGPDPDFGDAAVCADLASCDGEWSSLWAEISTGAGCIGCHEVGSPLTDSAGGGVGFDVMGDPCAALDNLKSVAATGPDCAGMGDYIAPSDADASLLVQKLRGGDALGCGIAMPLGNALANNEPQLVERLAAWVDAGANAPECP